MKGFLLCAYHSLHLFTNATQYSNTSEFSFDSEEHNAFVYHVLLPPYSSFSLFIFCRFALTEKQMPSTNKFYRNIYDTSTIFFALSFYPVGILLVVCVVFQRGDTPSCIAHRAGKEGRKRCTTTTQEYKWEMKTFVQTVALVIITAERVTVAESDESTSVFLHCLWNFGFKFVQKKLKQL